MTRLPFWLSALLLAASAQAQFDPDQFDNWLRNTYPADQPGVTVIGVMDGEVVFKGAYGLANLELEVPLEPDMVLRLGSLTKQFTATAIMMLEQEGKLSLSDDINKYLPDYNTQGRTITIEHLLTHTSGIPNHTAQEGWSQHYRHKATNENMFAFWQDLPLEFEPGDRYSYCNSGYWMLGAIVEAASGMSYQQFVEERIFSPLGMTSSYHDQQARLIPRRASGYWANHKYHFNAPFVDMSRPGAAGALASSVEDLARWDASLYTEQLLPAGTWQRMWTPYKLNNGDLSHYGYGWALGEHKGSTVVSHDGSIFGFQSSAVRMPEQRLYVAVLSNGAAVEPRTTAQRLALSMLGEHVDHQPIEMSIEELQQYQGVYRMNEHQDRWVTVSLDGLHTHRDGARGYQARPLGDDRFLYSDSNSLLVFHRNAEGVITHQEVQGFGVAPNRAELTDEPLPAAWTLTEIDPAILDDYTGEYSLTPNMDLTVWSEDGRLIVKASGYGPNLFSPAGNDVFFLPAHDAVVRFRRGEDGQVQSLTLEQYGRASEADRISNPPNGG